MKVQIEANLVKDPIERQSRAGNSFAIGRIATRIHKNDKSKTTYIDVLAFDKSLVQVLMSARVKDRIFVQGRLSLNDWTNNEGVTITQFAIAAEIIEIDSRAEEQRSQYPQHKYAGPRSQAPQHGDWQDDDLPF